MSTPQIATIAAIGRAGDGVTRIDGQTYFIPFAIPGDKYALTTDEKGHLLDYERISSSLNASEPPCALFGQCGGCATQRLPFADQLAWKTSRVFDALEKAGFALKAPSVVTQARPYTRRRVDLAVIKTPEHITIGLHRRKGGPIDMVTCHLLDPKIFDLLDPLRKLIHCIGAITGTADVHINLTDSGADISIRSDARPSASDRSKLAAFSTDHDVARISWSHGRVSAALPEVVAQVRPLFHLLDGARISLPPGAFMQATPEGERAIIDSVIRFLPKLNKRDIITELYSGIGTLSLPLSAHGRVEAYEGQTAAVSAVEAARAGKRLQCFNRDLTRQPLLEKDLARSRVLVMDPPRAGAGFQAMRAAASGVKDIIYVSCSPSALQTDLTFFAHQGYALKDWSIIDQFLWSAETESVIALTLDKKRLARAVG